MEDQSIEEILSALKSRDSDNGIEKLMTELNNSPRDTKSASKQEVDLDQILSEIGETKNNANQKQQTSHAQTTAPKDNTFPKELAEVSNDIKKQKTDRAKEWLKQLDPLSGEGIWFKEFAKHYDSELSAALDYLQ